MNKKIVEIIIAEAEAMNEELEDRIPVELGREAPLFGSEGNLDSLGLVTMVVAVEQSIEDEFDATLTLADEKAMSQKTSPFLTIGSLADYACRLLKGEN